MLCVGDVMLDRFVYGVVNRISPEAPVPVLRQTRMASMPGGAANVARNLASLGLQAIIIGAVGTDEAGIELNELLEHSPGISAHLVPLKERPTTLKTRLVAGGQQLLRLDAEEVGALARPASTRSSAPSKTLCRPFRPYWSLIMPKAF